MSHFSVAVITTVEPSDDVLSKILQPWHEFECTGVSDEYVIDVDITEEKREDYLKDTERRYRDPEGKLHSPYLDEFYREPTPEEAKLANFGSGASGGLSWHSRDWGDGKGYRAKIHFLPEGWKEEELPSKDLMSFRDWLEEEMSVKVIKPGDALDLKEEHKYGHVAVDEKGEVVKVVDRTNPNKKWDWWQVGGRYSGQLSAGYDPSTDPRNLETCWLCEGTGKRNDEIGREARRVNPAYTCNSCNGTGKAVKFPSHWVQEGNIARIGSLDLAAMKKAAVDARRKWVEAIVVKSGLDSETFQKAYNAYKNAHAKWSELPEPRPRGGDYREWIKTQEDGDIIGKYSEADVWHDLDIPAGQTIEQYIESAPALRTFAVVKDGVWYERGKMGWWACVFDEKAPDAWSKEFDALLAGLDPNTYISIVDCHI